MGDVHTAPADPFFEKLTRGYTDENPRFLRRDWLAQRLAAALEDDTRRFILLKGEPGAGKSVFMAQLARDNPAWLRYFIRGDQQRAASNVSSKSFLLHIGFQLACLHRELFREAELRVSVKMRLGEVAEGAEAVGAEVKRLVASPFYKRVVEIEQDAGVNRGRIVGLKVDEMVANAHLLDSADLLNLALMDPARALERIVDAAPIVILIDAIDEVRYHSTADNILTFLTNCPDLPPNVRFVISSRELDADVDLFCKKQQPRLATLTIQKEDAFVVTDVKNYANKLVSDPRLDRRFDAFAGGADAFEAKIVEKAAGNLGYLDALARAVDQAIAAKDEDALSALLALEELPSNLEGLYAFFLHQIKGNVSRSRIEFRDVETGDVYEKDAWAAVYNPLLGILAAAMEPVDADHLIRLGLIRADFAWVTGAIDRLTQFLDVTGGGYRLYHATVAEFLTSDRTRDDRQNADLYQDPSQLHRWIAAYYWKRHADDWTSCKDGYALRHLATHLFKVCDSNRLRSLICKRWMLARRTEAGSSLQGFADDVMLAMMTQPARGGSAVEELTRLHVARQLVFEDAGSYGDSYLEALVALGRASEAFDLARLRSVGNARFRGLLAVYRSLPQGAEDRTKRLADVEGAAEVEEDVFERSLAIAELGAVLARAGDANGSRLLGDAINLVESMEPDRKRFGWSKVAEFLADAGDARAPEIFGRAVGAYAGDRDRLQQLAKELSRPGLESAAPLVLDQAARLSSADNQDYIREWICYAHVEAGRLDAAENVTAIMRDPGHTVNALCNVASAVKAGEPARAKKLLERAAASAAANTGSQARSYELGQIAVVFESLDSRRADELFADSEVAAKHVKVPFNREHARVTLILHLSRAGRHQQAAHVRATIENPTLKLELARFFVSTLAAGGWFEEAERAVTPSGHHVYDQRALADLTEALIRHRKFREAERIAASMSPSGMLYAVVMSGLVEALAESGDLNRAVEIAVAMLRGRDTADTLARLAARLARAGDPRAPALLARAGEAAAAAQAKEAAQSHDDALLAVAQALSRLGEHHAAEQVALMIEGWDAKVSAYVIAAEGAKASDPVLAKRLIDDAVELLDAPPSEHRMNFLGDISIISQKNLVDDNLLKDVSRRRKILAAKLAAANELDRAREIAGSIALDDIREEAMASILTARDAKQNRAPDPDAVRQAADAQAIGGDPIAALATLASLTVSSPYGPRRPTDRWLGIVAGWTDALERTRAGRGKRVLITALETAGWIRPDWAQVSRIAAGVSN